MSNHMYILPQKLNLTRQSIRQSSCRKIIAMFSATIVHDGGVLIAHRDDVIATPVKLDGIKDDCELTVSKIKMSSNKPPLYVMAYYRSQIDNSANTSLDSLESAIKQVVELVGNSKSTIILAGDFNCPGIDWDNLVPGNRVVGVSEKLIQITTEHGLSQQQRDPTKLDALLDLVFTNNESLIHSTSTIPGISTANEHESIVVDLDLKAEVNKSIPHTVYQWSQVNWVEVKRRASVFAERFCREYEDKSAKEQGEAVQGFIDSLMKDKKLIPSKLSRNRTDLPYMDRNLKRMCRKKRRLYTRWKKRRGSSSACKVAREAYKRFSQETGKALREARCTYISGILTEGLEQGSQKPFWSYIKSQRTETVGVAPLKQNGTVHSEPGKKAEILAEQFRSVFTVDQDQDGSASDPTVPPAEEATLHGPSYPPMPEITFTVNGVEALLKGINHSKAAGPDEIPCRLLQETHEELAPVFTLLFQTSYDTGSLPDLWKTAWITPVFKKGDKSEAVNYRPVSLTCVACKLMEHVIVSNIRCHLDTHGILTPYQHGFRKNLSCESQLILTSHDLLKRLDAKEEVDMGVLDFSKAFDVVPHRRLMSKLRLYGIHGKNSQWINSFLTGRTQSVIVNGARSHSGKATAGDPVLSGVPQGTVLGPLLFLTYINDLPSILDPDTQVRLFADDCLVYRSIKSFQDQVILQRDMESLYSWGLQWGLRFNVLKCNTLHHCRSPSKPVRFYSMGGEVIASKPEAQYLGVALATQYYGTRSSPWKSHVRNISSKGNSKLGFLKRSLRGCPYSLRAVGYLSLVRSSLEYAGAVWDPTVGVEIERLEQVQHRAARWVRGYGPRDEVSVSGLLRTLGWHTLQDRRRIQRLVLFYKVIKNELHIDQTHLDLHLHRPNTYKKHSENLRILKGKDTNSPLWNGTVARTISDWNNLDNNIFTAAATQKEPVLHFKRALLSASP